MHILFNCTKDVTDHNCAVSENPRFFVTDFETLPDERRSHLNSDLLLDTKKEPCI